MKINKHGLKIIGLKKASGNTANWAEGSGGYTEVFYNRSTGEVWTVDQVSIGFNSWTEYHSSDILKVGNFSRHATMQQLADAVYQAVKARQAEEKMYALERAEMERFHAHA